MSAEQNPDQALRESMVRLSNLEIEDYRREHRVVSETAVVRLLADGFAVSPDELLAEVEAAEQRFESGVHVNNITL